MSAAVIAIGACVVCGKRARLTLSGCPACVAHLGERWFALAEKCRRQPAFARAVFAKIKDRRGQARFVELFGADVLGMDATPAIVPIDLERKLESEGRWVRRGEQTIPPPPIDEVGQGGVWSRVRE